MSSERWWPAEESQAVEKMMLDGMSISEIAEAYKGRRTYAAIKNHVRFIRMGRPWRGSRGESGYTPSIAEERRNAELRPIHQALREWGHITRTGQLRPIVKVELEKVA